MDIRTLLILNTAGLAVMLVIATLLLVGMLRAEWKVHKLGGKSWAFREPKTKKRK